MVRKVSDKVKVIDALIDKCDKLIIGGGMCFTFLKSPGLLKRAPLLWKKKWVERAGKMLEKAKEKGVEMLLRSMSSAPMNSPTMLTRKSARSLRCQIT